MAAAVTLSKKKNNISKGKLKKTIKNVLCRPDPVFWPVVSEEHENVLLNALNKYKVHIPQFSKPHWKELKTIPKEKRPKPPKIKKVDGLIFGISQSNNAIQNNDCSAVIIDSGVNPRTIVQPILEACTTSNIPLLCLKELKKITAESFGIPTSCLVIQKEHLLDLRNEIIKISKHYKQQQIKIEEEMEIDEQKPNQETEANIKKEPIQCPYLYRTDKKSRVFVPTGEVQITKISKKFAGQDFIEFSKAPKKEHPKKAYMNMLLKKISNNPNRVKIK